MNVDANVLAFKYVLLGRNGAISAVPASASNKLLVHPTKYGAMRAVPVSAFNKLPVRSTISGVIKVAPVFVTEPHATHSNIGV